MIDKPHVWACLSGASCVAGFVEWAIPYLQFVALLISIAAGIKAWLASRKPKA